MVVFFVDRTRCKINDIEINDGEIFNNKDY